MLVGTGDSGLPLLPVNLSSDAPVDDTHDAYLRFISDFQSVVGSGTGADLHFQDDAARIQFLQACISILQDEVLERGDIIEKQRV